MNLEAMERIRVRVRNFASEKSRYVINCGSLCLAKGRYLKYRHLPKTARRVIHASQLSDPRSYLSRILTVMLEDVGPTRCEDLQVHFSPRAFYEVSR